MFESANTDAYVSGGSITTTPNIQITDDIIYVADASTLTIPNFSANAWGIVTINGERIMYRNIDHVANTISGLLRGTAGTADAIHSVGSLVYDISRGNLLPEQFQDYVVSNSTLADGTTTTFVAPDITGNNTVLAKAVRVYIAGVLQSSGYVFNSYSPVTITFNAAPAAGLEVTILVRRGVTWYAPGLTTPSNGVPLQETETAPALFLQGN